jgi:hypothetical protein
LYFIARRRVLLVEETHDESSTDLQASQPSIETLTTQHQSEIERLQKNNTALEIDIDLRRQELSNYAWLHEMANAQAKDIDKYVIVERVFLCELRLTDPIQIPYVEFWLDIINTSVYDITVHTDTIEGRIKFQLNNLLEGKEIIFPYESIPPSSRGNVNIKQRLNPTEVNLLAPYEHKREEALPLFNLDDLGIVISGGAQFPQVERKHLTIPQITGSQDTAQLIAEPNIKIEILEALYRGFVSQNEGILAMTININVRLTNLRRTRIDIKNFRLRIMLHGTTYVSDAAQGEIHEGKFKDDKGEIRSVGQRLQNLNFDNDFPLGIEPEQPVGGWLQFSVDGQYASDADPKPSATLMIVDTLGNQHDENCKLTYKGKMLPI